MTTNLQQDTHDTQLRALNARRAQLEHRVRHYSTAVRESDGDDPCLGRELDASRSLLAQVHTELALLLRQGRGDGTA